MLSSFSKSFRNSFRKIRKNDDERRDDKRTQSMNINRSYSTDAHIYSASFMTCKESQNNSINLERSLGEFKKRDNPLSRVKSSFSLGKMNKTRLSASSFSAMADVSQLKSVKGYLRVKFGESGWKRHYAILHQDTIALYAEKYDVNPVMESTLTGNIVAPGETYTRKKYAFCVKGAHTHLLFSCKDKDDLFRWMNAASLASIGYDAEEGKTIGIKKNRYNSCSIRMNRGRKIFKQYVSVGSDGQSISSKEDDLCDISLIQMKISREETLSRKNAQMQKSKSTASDIMRLVDVVDITSGLTRKQTMKRRAEKLSSDPKLNELLHKKLQLERELRSMNTDLEIIDKLFEVPLTNENIDDFLQKHGDIIPELKQATSLEDSFSSPQSDISSNTVDSLW